MSFEVPEHVRPIRDAVLAFMLERVEPAEPVLHQRTEESRAKLKELQADDVTIETVRGVGYVLEDRSAP